MTLEHRKVVKRKKKGKGKGGVRAGRHRGIKSPKESVHGEEALEQSCGAAPSTELGFMASFSCWGNKIIFVLWVQRKITKYCQNITETINIFFSDCRHRK